MKIDNSIKSSGAVSGDTKTRSTQAAAKSSPAPSSETKVQLSSLAGSLQQAEQIINDTPVVDSAKVSEIKQAISEGRFQVNAEHVADGLIESVRQMLASQPRTA